MAVNSASNRSDAVGTGAQVAFPYTFNVYTTSDLQVYVGGVLTTINTDYTQSTPNVPGGVTGGTVTFVTPPGNGVAVLLLRVLPYTQATQFTNLDKFDAKSAVEGSFDKGVMQTQQVVEQLGRAVTVPVSSLLSPVLMPDPTIPGNFGAGLKIKGDGTGIDTFIINQGNITGLVTTKGDILIFGAGVADRLGVGANDSILIADSTQAKGLRWSAAPANLTLTNATLSGTLTGLINAITGQIQFPASQNPSADPNTLDDYEEGTWTPGISFNNGTTGITYAVQAGRYTKIGRLVTVEFHVALSSKGSSTGAARISGLPFTINATANLQGSGPLWWNAMTSTLVNLTCFCENGTTRLIIYGLTAAATALTPMADTNFGNASEISGTFTYSV